MTAYYMQRDDVVNEHCQCGNHKFLPWAHDARRLQVMFRCQDCGHSDWRPLTRTNYDQYQYMLRHGSMVGYEHRYDKIGA